LLPLRLSRRCRFSFSPPLIIDAPFLRHAFSLADVASQIRQLAVFTLISFIFGFHILPTASCRQPAATLLILRLLTRHDARRAGFRR
jgi:hypothetical protein